MSPRRNNKLRLMTDYFRSTPDPDRGWALAALTGALSFQHAKPGIIRALIAERTDPVLFDLSYDYVGDLSETVALMWPVPSASDPQQPRPHADRRRRHALDARQGAAARADRALARCARRDRPLGAAQARHRRPAHRRLGAARQDRGRRARQQGPAGDRADLAGPEAALCRPVRLARRPRRQAGATATRRRSVLRCWRTRSRTAISPRSMPEDFMAEWKWDGIRVQAVADVDSEGRPQARLYSRTGEDISGSFPDLVDALRLPGAIDGELLVVREGRVQSFNVLQQRLNRKTVNAKLLADFPAHLRAYDLLVDGDEDLREQPFAERRARLEAFVARLNDPRVDLSPLIPFATWDELAAARANPDRRRCDAEAVEGVMLKRRDAPYVPGRPKGLWWKWKRDPCWSMPC